MWRGRGYIQAEHIAASPLQSQHVEGEGVYTGKTYSNLSLTAGRQVVAADRHHAGGSQRDRQAGIRQAAGR